MLAGGVELNIRKITEKDWPGVSAVYLEGIRSGKATLLKEMPPYAEWDAKQHPGLRFAAVEQNSETILGFVSVHDGGHKGALVSVYVAEAFQRRGIGAALMQKLQEECAQFGYAALQSRIFEDNIPSVRLHLKTGFRKTGVLAGPAPRRIEVYEWSPENLLFEELAQSVVEMDEETAARTARKIVSCGLDAWDAIDRGLVRGMERAGGLFEQEEYFIPELLMCADAMNEAMAVLKPHVKKSRASRGRIVIGSISGDTHDIGKNIVALVIESAGFDVRDLGRDVSARAFVDAAVKFEADIIAMSSLMTTTMENMADVARLLVQENRRDDFILLAGGRPLSRAFASKIGADYYAKNAADALRLVKRVLRAKNREC